MNLLPFNLYKGIPYTIPNNESIDWFRYSYLLRMMYNISDKVNIISTKISEPYVILGTINRFDWYKNLDLWPKDILNDLRSGFAKLIINNDNEAFGLRYSKTNQYDYPIDVNIINLCKNSIDALQIDKDNLLYMDSNYKLPAQLNKKGYKGLFNNIWETRYEGVNLSNQILNKTKRQYKFLYLGGKPRIHRLKFYHYINLLNGYTENTLQSIGYGFFYEGNKKITVEPKILDDDEILHNNGIKEEIAALVNYDFHKACSLNIIPMSFFHFSHDLHEINEKIWKPIVTMQPFVIIGQPKTLKYLKDIGYKTFDKWIDESYDDTLDDDLRFQKILNEIARLNEFSKDEFAELLFDMHEVLLYNYSLNRERRLSLTIEHKVFNNIKKELNLC